MKIYSKTGDDGTSALYAQQARLKKSDPVFGVLGSLDELNASLGFLHLSKIKQIKLIAYDIQRDLFLLGSYVAGKKMEKRDCTYWETRLKYVEETIDKVEAQNTPLTHFILPGGSVESSYLHVCRVQARKLERIFVKYKLERKLADYEFVQKYLNRISDLFFALARYANKKQKIEDVIWKI